MDGLGSGLFDELVDKSDVGEGTSGHNFVITSSGTISVEVLLFNSLLLEESSSRRVLGDITSRGNVISGDGVTKVKETVSILDILDFGKGQFSLLEEGRVMDVSGVLLPLILLGLGGIKGVPSVSTLGDSAINFLEHFRLEGFSNHLVDFASVGPDVLQEDILTFLILTDGFGVEVNVEGTSEGIGNNERRRGQIVGSGQGMDSAFEVSVTRKDGTSNEITFLDSFRDFLGEVTGVTDTGHATVTSNVETEFIKELVDTGLLEIFSDDTRSWGEGSLDVRLDLQSFGQGVSGNETSSHHDTWVRGVGAGSDGSNNDITMSNGVFISFKFEFDFLVKLVFSKTEALEADLVSEAGIPILLHVVKSDSVVGSLGSRDATSNSGEIKFEGISENGVFLGAIIDSEETLSLKILLNVSNLVAGSVGLSKILKSTSINWEVTHSGTVFGGHVSNGGSVSEGKSVDTRSVEFDEFADDTLLSEHFSDGQDQISGGGGLGKFTSELETNNLGQDHGDRLTKHGGFTFDTTNTPGNNTKTVNHGGVGVSSDKGIRVEGSVAIEDDSGKIFKIDLMDDTRSGRNNQEVVEGILSPLQEFESFVVSLEFHLFVLFKGIGGSGKIDLDGVINNEIDRAKGINLIRASSESDHSISHGSKINNGRDTSEILKDDSGGLEGDFNTSSGILFPIEDLVDIRFLDGEVVTVSDGTLEEDSDGEGELLDIFSEVREREVVESLVANLQFLSEL